MGKDIKLDYICELEQAVKLRDSRIEQLEARIKELEAGIRYLKTRTRKGRG